MGINLSDPFPSDTWLETEPVGMGTWLTGKTLGLGGRLQRGGEDVLRKLTRPP